MTTNATPYLFTDEERTHLAARAAALKSTSFEADDELFSLKEAATAALSHYQQNRLYVLDSIQKLLHLKDHYDPELDQQAELFKDMYLEILRKSLLENSLCTLLTDRCERVHRFIQGIRCAIEGISPETITPYTGEVSLEAEAAMHEELCELLAYLNVSGRDIPRICQEIRHDGTALAGYFAAKGNNERLLNEAIALYQLAHEGRLPRFHPAISMEECVHYVSLSQDIDLLRKAETAGTIGMNVGAILAFSLVIAAGVACIVYFPWVFIALSELSSGLLSVIMMLLSLTSLTLGFATLHCVTTDKAGSPVSLADKVMNAGSSIGAYLTLALPMQARKLYRKLTGAAEADLPLVGVLQQQETDADDAPLEDKAANEDKPAPGAPDDSHTDEDDAKEADADNTTDEDEEENEDNFHFSFNPATAPA